tara:strand:+ start:8673 stop:10298 length:1626 start_codon:yes stop_codon:yes gene_type:complete
MTKTTPILLDRLAGALAAHNVKLKRTHLLQVAARAFGLDNTHKFTAADKNDEIAPPEADYLGCDEVSGYGMMEFFGDPEGGIFAVQKDRIDGLSGRANGWILSPMGGVLDISHLRKLKDQIVTAANERKVACANCEWIGDEDECRPIEHISERVMPGEIMPAGECPKCGAVAHIISDEDAEEMGYRKIIRKEVESIRKDFDNAEDKGHRPEDTMDTLLKHLEQAEAFLKEESYPRAQFAVADYNDALSAVRASAKLIDPEAPIYLTNGCCEFAHDDGWMFEGSNMETGLFDDDFYPLTEQESQFIAEDLVTSDDGRMHALTGYSALYRGKKHVMPSIELAVGDEHDAPSKSEVQKIAKEYIANILPKVQQLGGNVLIDEGIDECVVIQMLFPIERVMKFKDLDTWFARLKWIMVDPTLPDYDPEEQFRHEGATFAVSVEWLGEGEEGDFQPLEPRDQPLLRFDAQKNIGIVDTVWEDIDNGSYCTQVPAYDPREILEAMPRYLVARLEAEGGNYPKRLMEKLSWVTQKDIREFIESEGKNG